MGGEVYMAAESETKRNWHIQSGKKVSKRQARKNE